MGGVVECCTCCISSMTLVLAALFIWLGFRFEEDCPAWTLWFIVTGYFKVADTIFTIAVIFVFFTSLKPIFEDSIKKKIHEDRGEVAKLQEDELRLKADVKDLQGMKWFKRIQFTMFLCRAAQSAWVIYGLFVFFYLIFHNEGYGCSGANRVFIFLTLLDCCNVLGSVHFMKQQYENIRSTLGEEDSDDESDSEE